MQLIFEPSMSTIWMFATPNELLELAAAAQQKITEARLGDSAVVFSQEIGRSHLTLNISVNKDSGKANENL